MSKKFSIIITVILILIYACGSDKSNEPDIPTSDDRDKFVGNWAGMYACANPAADTIVIAKASGNLNFTITLHAQAFYVEVVSGELTETNVISISGQNLGGFPGSAEITYADNMLSLSQTGIGITCQGTNYQIF